MYFGSENPGTSLKLLAIVLLVSYKSDFHF